MDGTLPHLIGICLIPLLMFMIIASLLFTLDGKCGVLKVDSNIHHMPRCLTGA